MELADLSEGDKRSECAESEESECSEGCEFCCCRSSELVEGEGCFGDDLLEVGVDCELDEVDEWEEWREEATGECGRLRGRMGEIKSME